MVGEKCISIDIIEIAFARVGQSENGIEATNSIVIQ